MNVGRMFFDEMELLIGVDEEKVVEDDVDAFTEQVDTFTQNLGEVTDLECCDFDSSPTMDVESKNQKRKVMNRKSAQLSRNRKTCKQQKQEITLEENATRIKNLEIKVEEQAARIRELEGRESSMSCGDVFEKEEI